MENIKKLRAWLIISCADETGLLSNSRLSCLYGGLSSISHSIHQSVNPLSTHITRTWQ